MIGAAVAFVAVALPFIFAVKYRNSTRKDALEVFKKVVTFSALLLMIGMILSPAALFAQTADGEKQVNGNAMIGVALSTGLAALGAGIAVGLTGSAAIGAISEDPRMLGRSLIFVGLAEGVAIYGLVISIMIFGRV